LRRDGDVHRLVQPAFAANPEIRLAAGAEARGRRVVRVLLHFHDQHVTKGCERLFIKRLGARVVGNRKSDVIDHL
jgi:hypothetical protein